MTRSVPFAAETHQIESAVSAEAVGIITLVILLALLIGTLVFGKGRQHS